MSSTTQAVLESNSYASLFGAIGIVSAIGLSCKNSCISNHSSLSSFFFLSTFLFQVLVPATLQLKLEFPLLMFVLCVLKL